MQALFMTGRVQIVLDLLVLLQGNWSTKSVGKEDEGFNSMIQFCTCIGRSASDLELKQNSEVSSPCKICGGKLLVDGRAAISGSSMLSTVGLELTRVIGLDLTWKTVSKGNRRGRRARTSLAAGHKKKSVSPNSKESEDLTDMNSEKVDNMPVSESEKLGVTILGRRFSDIVEKVPIKKRKFLFDRSLSPQAHVPSPCLDESGLLDSRSKVPTGSTQNSNEKMCEKSALNLDVEQGPAVSGKNSVQDKNEKLRDDVDFSGISILATAACDSNTEGVAPPAEGSEGSCGIADNQNIESSLTHAESFEGKQQSCMRVSGGKADLNAGVKLPVEEISRSVETNKDYQTENSTPGRVESSSSSRDDRSRWDLNKVMDEWESHYEDPVMENECHEECETHKENLENGNLSLESRNSDFLVETTLGKRPSVAEIVSTLEEHQLDTLASLQDTIIPCKVDSTQNDLLDLDSKTLHSQEDSSIAEIISASAGRAPCILTETHTLVEEKPVVQCPPSFDSEKVEVINQASFLDHGIHIFESEKITSSGGHQGVSTNGNLGNTGTPLIKDPQSNGHGCYIDSEGAFFKIVDTLTADPVIDRASCPAADKSVDPTFCQVGSDALISLASSGCRKLLTTIPDVGEGRVNRDSNLLEDGVSLVADQQFQIDNVGKSTCEDSVFDNQINDLRSPDSWRKDTDTRSPGQTVLEDLYSSDYYSDVSQNDGDNDDGMENVGKLQAPDDDYQYEDGEFRESALHSWGDDAGDEGDAEHVDYGSDNRDMDTFEAPADSTSLQVDSIETEAKTIVEKIGQEIDRLPGVSCSSESNHLAGIGANRTAGVVRNISTGFFGGKDTREQFGLKVKVTSELQINEAKVVEDEFDSKRDSVRELGHFENSRMKFSGWDQLPGIRKSSEAVYEDHSGEGKSFRKVIRSMSGRELPSRIEGLKTSDPSFRKDKVYVQGSRSDSHDNSNPRFERDASPGKSIGRGGSSLRMRGRGRGCDPWLDSAAGHWGPKRHHSPAYYGPGDFRPSEPKNAAAAAAAKAESSGFVVAPDGTILKPGCVGPSAQRSRQAVNSSSQGVRRRGSPTDRDVGLNFAMKLEFGSTREMSLERSINVGRGRSGRYNNIGRRERYNGPAPDESFDNQHLLPQRERSFSPIPRRARHLCRSQSHTKSRSRSRSRSPRMWASPREGRSGGFNSGPGLRQHSRSPPNFRSEARFDRVMSPHRRPGLGERVVGLFPARSHWSPPHASRWIDDRKNTFDHSPPHPSRWIDDRKSAFDHFREKGYKRSLVSERNDAGRIFSRNHNLHMMPSPGRMNPDEYYRPMHADRLPDFAVVDRANRGMRRDGSDDDRKKPSDRCGPVHPVRHHDIEGKHFRYVDDGFRGHNPRSRSGPNFHGRGNPRDYGRGIECRFGDGPRRGREEKGHFGYDRERKQNSGFETFRVRECEDDVTPGRPSC